MLMLFSPGDCSMMSVAAAAGFGQKVMINRKSAFGTSAEALFCNRRMKMLARPGTPDYTFLVFLPTFAAFAYIVRACRELFL